MKKQELINTLKLVLCFLVLTWLAVFAIVSFQDYKFVYSDKILIKSLQIFIEALWGIVASCSPLWVIGGTLLLNDIINKNER